MQCDRAPPLGTGHSPRAMVSKQLATAPRVLCGTPLLKTADPHVLSRIPGSTGLRLCVSAPPGADRLSRSLRTAPGHTPRPPRRPQGESNRGPSSVHLYGDTSLSLPRSTPPQTRWLCNPVSRDYKRVLRDPRVAGPWADALGRKCHRKRPHLCATLGRMAPSLLLRRSRENVE